MADQLVGQSPMPGDAVYCHCYPVFRCEPAVAEVEGPDVWRPVCEQCQQIAFDNGLRVRKLSTAAVVYDAGPYWGNAAIDPNWKPR